MSKERITYHEKYRPGSMVFPPNKMPVFVHLSGTFGPAKLELRAAGVGHR